MNYYRSVIGAGGGNPKDFTATVNGMIKENVSAEAFFEGNETINYDIEIGDKITSCANLLFGCENFNKNVKIGANVTNCHQMLYGTNMRGKSIVFPKKAQDLSLALGWSNFYGNVKINNSAPNVYGLIGSRADNSHRVNIWCSNQTAITSGAILGDPSVYPITWTSMTNGYYNAQQNIYFYYNYTGT